MNLNMKMSERICSDFVASTIQLWYFKILRQGPAHFHSNTEFVTCTVIVHQIGGSIGVVASLGEDCPDRSHMTGLIVTLSPTSSSGHILCKAQSQGGQAAGAVVTPGLSYVMLYYVFV